MSTTKRITLHCDHATSSSTRACEQSFRGDSDKVGEVRDAAAELGWVRKGNAEDYCALHVDDAGEGAA